MREYEMRVRIERFLKARMRGMLAPALGLGMAVAGCKQEGVTPVDSAPLSDGSMDRAAQIIPDTAPRSPDVGAADTPRGTDTPAVASDTPLPDAKDAPANDTMDAAIDTAKPDRIAQEVGPPEAGTEVAGPEAGPDTKESGADARKDLGLVVKYIAQFPDGGGVIALYMASMPEADS